MNSTAILRALGLGTAVAAGACGDPAPEPPRPVPAPVEHGSPGDLQAPESPRELRHRLLPRLVRGGAAEGLGSGLLRLDPALGLGVRPILRKPGHDRTATRSELAAILALGEPLAAIYRRNLGRLLPQAGLVAVGGRFADEARLLDLDTTLPGIEACLLLPEVWDKAEAELGHPVWAALPDRRHCLFFPAGPWRILTERLPELADWSTQGSEPLSNRLFWRDGTTLRAGPAFADLLVPPHSPGK